MKHNTPLHFHTVKNIHEERVGKFTQRKSENYISNYVPYQAGLFVLADEKRQHTVGHLISPRWFHPDQIFQMTRVRCRQDPIFDADLTKI